MRRKKTVILWSIQRIIVPADFYDPITTAVVDACILVDAKGVLIYGLSTLRWYQDQGKEQIPVIVVDLNPIKPETPFLENFDCTFSISQRSAMSAAFKKTAPKRQGLRFDLLEKKASEPKNIEKVSELRSPGYEVKGRTDEWMAKIFGFTSKELLVRAQNLYQHAPEWLILAVDREKVPITKAFRMLKKPEALEACRQALFPALSTPSTRSGGIESLKKSEKVSQKKECHDETLC